MRTRLAIESSALRCSTGVLRSSTAALVDHAELLRRHDVLRDDRAPVFAVRGELVFQLPTRSPVPRRTGCLRAGVVESRSSNTNRKCFTARLGPRSQVCRRRRWRTPSPSNRRTYGPAGHTFREFTSSSISRNFSGNWSTTYAMAGENRRMRLLALALLVQSLACTKPNPAKSCADGGCSDPAFPFCDVDGAITGEPLTCTAIACTPGEVVACRDDQVLLCTDSGTDVQIAPCTVGACNTTPVAHCPYLEPRYLPDVCDTVATDANVTYSNSATLDTDLDSNCNGGIVIQEAAPEICVVRYGTISIATGITLDLKGSRVAAFVADGDLDIVGTLDSSANSTTNGAGGGFFFSGGNEGCAIAGGGAGFKTAGGAGGNATSDGGAGNGGGLGTDPTLLSALVGGNRPMLLAPTAPTSGGGGGGVTLISCHAAIVVDGVIDASGGGGRSGFLLAFPGCAVGATGGGSGGNVVLQALSITVTGSIFANGGGGGSGRPMNQQKGLNGGDGLQDTSGGLGAISQGGGDGAGGFGGSGTSNPAAGKRSTDPAASAGGGGGSVGFFQTYTPDGVFPSLNPTVASPDFRPNLNVDVR